MWSGYLYTSILVIDIIEYKKKASEVRARTIFMYTAAAAKSLQSCPTLCNPIDGSPPGFPVPEIFQARTLEWVAISFPSE